MGGSSVEFTCIDEGDPCAGGRVSCDGPEDCESGQKCCGSVGGGLHAECVAGDAVCDGAELCHDSPDCTGEGAMCCALPLGSAAFCSAETCPAF